MSQTAITLAFEHWKAQQGATGEPVLLDEFVFANVPGLNPDIPVDRSEALPPVEQIVHRQPVTRTGVVNENGVVYSAVLGADVGDFSFNWIGLLNKASGTLAMIVHAPLQQKLKTAEGQQGNVLTRSFLMEYNGAQTETGINTPAETWQIDFTARMAGMDERQRLENTDIYGAAAFFGDGWLVGKTGNQFFVTKGTGYVAGLRTSLADNQNITVTTKPVKVWLDVCWTGALTSVWNAQCKITVAENLADYVQNGVQHYVFAVASIDVNGNITDLRPKGTLNEQQASDALKKHEQSRNHPDATTSAKGFTQLSSATDSTSEGQAATPKAVKIAMDNANARLAKERNGADIPNPPLFVQNIGLQDTVNKAAGALQKDQNGADVPDKNLFLNNVGAIPNYPRGTITNNGTMASAATPGWWLVSVANPDTVADFPTDRNGSKLYGYGFMFVGRSGDVWLQQYFTHHGMKASRQTWNGDMSVQTAWVVDYNTSYKPTASEVGALPITGGTVSGYLGAIGIVQAGDSKKFSLSSANNTTKNADFNLWGSAERPVVIEMRDDSGWHFYSQRNTDGSITFSINGQVTPSNYGNFDARYQPRDNYATQEWVLQNFVQNIDLTAPAEVGFRDGWGYPRGTDGAAMYNFSMVGGSSNVGNFIVRYTRKLVNNTWYVIN
ncbi:MULTISPECIES: phage tail protein [Citrobacter]|uniref:phage tail-collar fiber domain-containing protein n=1 Tax=Citrobacter TaxID=544 RepID=UPI000652304C|nr:MULTISPECIES: phage tail protein [Citrobacter freundii complex]EGS5520273.1 phage tail protein [Citrobacter freundii]MCY3416479.1 phage tail protein [Citrobacter freundii]